MEQRRVPFGQGTGAWMARHSPLSVSLHAHGSTPRVQLRVGKYRMCNQGESAAHVPYSSLLAWFTILSVQWGSETGIDGTLLTGEL